MLYLRTVYQDRRSYNSFQWPSEIGSRVVCPDWDPTPECGNGLHGLLWGQGKLSLLNQAGIWQVVEYNGPHAIDLGGVVKFPECILRYDGDRLGAVAFLEERAPSGVLIPWGTRIAGRYGVVAAGTYGVAIAGDYGTAAVGVGGKAFVGYEGTAFAGDYAVATAGDLGTAIAGNYGAATAGDYGTATSGAFGKATVGFNGTATVGAKGKATAGPRGIATTGKYGIATAGDYGILNITWFDGERFRISIAYVGENGIKPNAPYRLDSQGNFIPVRTPTPVPTPAPTPDGDR